MSDAAVTLRFASGTIEVRGLHAGPEVPAALRWDARSACLRAPAIAYAEVIRWLVATGVAFEDQARAYPILEEGARIHHEPRPYQVEALEAWRARQHRGVIVLPTGAGKTQVALMAIDDRRRAALVVAPTLDLVRQWYDLLRSSFPGPIGVVGGGEHDVQPLTVTTYDSAHLHMEHLGARFGLIVFDECHHLPGASYAMAARLCLAPYRLGLTATPERTDGREAELDELVGPIALRRDIGDLQGEYLSDYDVERVTVDLSPEERAEYEAERALYTGFLRRMGVQMSGADGWSEFVKLSARTVEGRRAMKAYRRQRELAFRAPAKLDYVDHLLTRHRVDRTLLFAQDNATAYAVSRRFLVPVITHQTKVRERSEILDGLRQGRYGAVATSRVLNEGVDVPEANVAIILSGSGSVREHVQRLGRILRKLDGKRAVLYELVTAATSEARTSARRRDHSAYR